VVGYTTFNEVQVLREKVLPLKPDVIVLQTCMNDVVDPELHWNRWSRTRRTAPPEAFPNPVMLEGSGAKVAAQREIWLARSRIVTEVRLLLLQLGLFTSNSEMNIEKNGSLWPTYTTYESNADLLPLTNYDSPEWHWLRAQLDQLRKLAGQTPVVLMIVPLAYELTPGYPLDPESQFMRYCQETGITCLNLREKFLGHAPEDLYVMKKPGSYPNLPDVWHFNRAGHELSARALAELLKEKGLIP
jgi:lysophospholipase L1-like esterase